MEDLRKSLKSLKAEVEAAVASLKLEEAKADIRDLQKEIEKPDFWKDSARARDVSKKEAILSEKVVLWEELQSELKDLAELLELNDTSLEGELKNKRKKAQEQFAYLKERDLKFQGPYDDHDVVLSIYAGAGGTDAQDWAQMLERMYLRWAERAGLKSKFIDESTGEEAGIKSATIELAGGEFLYGRLAGEHGVHRLVRLSPFNADHKRQTSFAKVDILPLVDQPGEIELDEKDLKIDVFRAGGHGGQSVNTTDSAVRVTHVTTGITVAIQNERSQLQNKETALNILRSKLVQLQLEQHAENLSDIKGPSQANEFGSQIRNYVLHPYKQVKDLRTGYESSDPQAILDGDLDSLISSWVDNIDTKS